MLNSRALLRYFCGCIAYRLCARLALWAACAFGGAVGMFADETRRDEGLWTFDSPPLKKIYERYKFTPTQGWLDTLRMATARFTGGGGSGAFVSPRGLVITNHHVVVEQLQRLSTPTRDIVLNGYIARKPAEELPCPNIEIDVLLSMKNITAQMEKVVKKDMTDRQAMAAREAEARRLESEHSSGAQGRRAEVVALYSGGEYWLYIYKRYNDVRLVAAPEIQAANFGGDSDNFTYPRYALDFTLLRVYENGKPLQTDMFLRWNSQGATEGEPLFVSGYPGSTSRLATLAQFLFNKEAYYPYMLRRINASLAVARRYAARGAKEARQAMEDILNDENAKKALLGELQGLNDAAIERKRRDDENELRRKVDADAELRRLYGNAWETVERAIEKQRVIFKESAASFSTPLAEIAFAIVRHGYEKDRSEKDKRRARGGAKNGEKTGEKDGDSADALLDELREQALSPEPLMLEYEEARFAGELEFLSHEMNAGDLFIQRILGEGAQARTPAAVAREAVRGTKLLDIAVRKALLDGGLAAVERSADPMITLMRKLVPVWREREEYRLSNIQAPIAAALEKIALARFAVYGKNSYPEADFSLRLSFGSVKNYAANGSLLPTFTTLYGLFDRAAGFARSSVAEDFALPRSLALHFADSNAAPTMPLSTPVNFVTTCDIAAGNSGSPLVNKRLEFVGLVFDGNMESLSGRFVYNEETGRTLAVHPAFIIAALRYLYAGREIADELEHATQSASRGGAR
jgi:hypothetical protein